MRHNLNSFDSHAHPLGMCSIPLNHFNIVRFISRRYIHRLTVSHNQSVKQTKNQVASYPAIVYLSNNVSSAPGDKKLNSVYSMYSEILILAINNYLFD